MSCIVRNEAVVMKIEPEIELQMIPGTKLCVLNASYLLSHVHFSRLLALDRQCEGRIGEAKESIPLPGRRTRAEKD